jgi:endonuclease YncB( thermonuclease family)
LEKSYIKYILLIILLSLLLPLYAQKVKITKIIDTNLFEINKQDTIKLANLEIPSKTIQDSLLQNFFLPYVLKYEKKRLLMQYFIMKYADSSDSLKQVRSVYLYEKHLLSEDLVNEYMLSMGYAKYVPLKDSQEQKKCEQASLKAKGKEKGIWKKNIYYHRDLGPRKISIGYLWGHRSDIDDSFKGFCISLKNEANRYFYYDIAYSQFFYEDLHYYEGTPRPPDKINTGDAFIKLALAGNAKYVGITGGLHLFILNYNNRGEMMYFPILPSIGLNIGLISKLYFSFKGVSVSQNRIYLFSISAHYLFSSPFKSISIYYYWQEVDAFYKNEAKVNLSYSFYKNFSLKLNASIIRFEEYYNGSKNYFSGSIGVGYIFH